MHGNAESRPGTLLGYGQIAGLVTRIMISGQQVDGRGIVYSRLYSRGLELRLNTIALGGSDRV